MRRLFGKMVICVLLISMSLVTNSSSKVLATESFEYNVDKYKNGLFLEETPYYFSKNLNVDKKLDNGEISYLATTINFENYIESQKNKLHIIQNDNMQFVDATIEEVKKFSNVNLYESNSNKLQFLRLNEFRSFDKYKLDEFFKGLKINFGNINIYDNKANIFEQAAKLYNIDPIYLVAHTLLETGNGNSNLAQGKYIKVDINGKAIKDEYGNIILADQNTPLKEKLKVYNFFGIGAIDGNPLIGGLTYAYNNGWTSIDNTIKGSAKWISENYINSSNPKFVNQNTLYTMKWDFTNYWHQYATDVEWALKISRNMYKLSELYIYDNLKFEIPRYENDKFIPEAFEKNKKNIMLNQI